MQKLSPVFPYLFTEYKICLYYDFKKGITKYCVDSYVEVCWCAYASGFYINC